MLLRVVPPLRAAFLLSISRGFRLIFSVRIGAEGSHVPHNSPAGDLATSMPGTARAVNRLRPHSSRANDAARF
jgi:hypothetical protein